MAQTTSNYGLYKPESTDTYNHLVYDNPNMDTIDGVMKDNADHAIDSATCIKTGTVHAVVRSNTSAPVFRFTATGDWNTGDSMTVDGNPVSVFLPNGEALINGAYVINSEVLCSIQGTRVTVYSNGINLPVINADDVVFDNTGTGLSATDAQAALVELNNKIFIEQTETQASYTWVEGAKAFLHTYTAPVGYSIHNILAEPTNSNALINAFYRNGSITVTGVTPNTMTAITSALEFNVTIVLKKL